MIRYAFFLDLLPVSRYYKCNNQMYSQIAKKYIVLVRQTVQYNQEREKLTLKTEDGDLGDQPKYQPFKSFFYIIIII